MDRPTIDHARRVRPRRAHGQTVSSHSRAQSRRLLGNDASVFPPMASGTRSRRTAEDIRSLGSCSRERDSRRSSQPLSQSLARSLQVLLHLRMAFLSPPFPVGSVTSLPTACTDWAESSPPATTRSPDKPPVVCQPGRKAGSLPGQSRRRRPGQGAPRLYRCSLHPGVSHGCLTRPWLGQAHHAVALTPASEGSLTAGSRSVKPRHSHHPLASSLSANCHPQVAGEYRTLGLQQ